MILSDSIFSGVMNTVDAVMFDYVRDVYINFIQANASLITLLFTLSVMLMGYQFISQHSCEIWEVLRRIILMMCVYGLVMNWQLYHIFIYNIFTNEPARIAKVLSGANHHSGNLFTALDGLFESMLNAMAGFFGQASFSASGMMFVVYGLIVLIISIPLIVYALLLFIYSKIMMAVGLALGPIFILCIMWDSVRGLFSAWLNMLITTALIPVITTAVLTLMLSVINVTLPQLNQPVEQMQLVGIAPFLVVCFTTVLILSQILHISSSLGGGITLSSLSTGAGIARNAWNTSGMPKAINKMKNMGRSTTTSIFPRGRI